MNREILFRGKRVDNGEWVYGNLIYENVSDKYYIDLSVNVREDDSCKLYVYALEVIPETIGQGTVLKNGLRIFEGDIYHHGDFNITYTVVWHDNSLIGKQNNSSSYAGLEYWSDRIKIIGNIFDKEVK